MPNEDDRRKLRHIFFDYAVKRQASAAHAGQRFVYYTRADTALKILSNREIWLRSASLMNDSSEIQHGMRCMETALNQGGTNKLQEIFKRSHPDIVERAIEKLRKSASAMFLSTHICSISEHASPHEDRLGRLSMWRAYGGSSGVALVFNSKAMFSDSNALSVYTSPVIYKSPQEFVEMFNLVCEILATNSQFIATQPTETVALDLYEMLHFAVLSTKHPAFIEEREWRLIHAPYYESSKRVEAAIETINALPQLVYKLPLKNIPEEGLTGMETAESLDRIIIGPTNNPIELSFVFHEALRRQGIENPYDRIVISGIPLRLPA